MKIVFLGYWGANEGLSQATINPHLEILTQISCVDQIFYISIERKKNKGFNIPIHSKIKHIPYYSTISIRTIQKFLDLLLIPLLIFKISKQNDIRIIMCRSSLAGSIGYIASKITGNPFMVESFEPHAEYMKELSIWSPKSISYLLQKKLEEKQKKNAEFLLPVSFAEKYSLINNGINKDKVIAMPCAVYVEKFTFSSLSRREIRNGLKISEKHNVGIYSGKFGGLYLNDEAFWLFKKIFEKIPDFHLIILTSENRNFLLEKFEKFGIQKEKVFIKYVSHDKVARYLSASDFAFSLHKPSAVSHAFSPIKNGEYWANGLPIISTPNIGDDSSLIKTNNIGIILDEKHQVDIGNLRKLISLRKKRSENLTLTTNRLCSKYRNFRIIEDVYRKILL